MIGELDTLVTMMVTQVRRGCITIGTLRARFIHAGMDGEELTLLMELVALEVKLGGLPSFAMRRETKTYNTSRKKAVPRLSEGEL